MKPVPGIGTDFFRS